MRERMDESGRSGSINTRRNVQSVDSAASIISPPPRCNALCKCLLSGADWCLQSDVMPDSCLKVNELRLFSRSNQRASWGAEMRVPRGRGARARGQRERS